MIRISNPVLPTSEQIYTIIMGMRNPMNSWDKSDSDHLLQDFYRTDLGIIESMDLIEISDLHLMNRLAKAGPEHRKYLRMMNIYANITAPLYWWKEFDTYKIGTVANSCSTMHKITAKEFTLDDFSHEQLYYDSPTVSEFANSNSYMTMKTIVDVLNFWRNRYLETKDKTDWYQIIQLLPSSYNQKRTVMLNYEVLGNIYHQRKNHKLNEWREFCEWIERLPYSKLITEWEWSDEEKKELKRASRKQEALFIAKRILADKTGLSTDESLDTLINALIPEKEN